MTGRRYAKAFRVKREPGAMNKGEARYADHLEMLKTCQQIHDWRFEAIKLRLADNTFLTIDFVVITKDLTVELHEYKGHWEDDARVKVKVAAELYPWFKIIAVQEPARNRFVVEHFAA